ncbi:PucR family transcriptional regulator ligand-binding domain-containing protein [Salipaludibacillus sp. CUR1]|uniref:PucR family transcriptional regulator n=1 Tax=Salipaludibacillus sp. CUR1 TaxID=2820003 RepID=UPI001E30E1AA|nr:PucR family transcriptional regulator [Salipaludibacillus sp. CUR1]MCE7791509.1 PucR family transcriptional regulator ligand-binding domain-containing protein [Salipaludibacillus sp. CUR1]
MGLTAADIVALPILKSAQVKAGGDLLDKKQIEWISVIEMPVENFVRENEFVLTTGLGCHGDPQLLEQFVKDVIQSGASALGFATGRYVFDIPDEILKIAGEHDFIIIDIPWEVRFGDIMQMVLEEINEDKKSERQRTEEIRQELINDVLQNKGLQEIAEALYRHIRIPVVITDYTRLIRASKNVENNTLLKFKNNEKKTAAPAESSNVTYMEHPLYPHIEEYEVGGEKWYQILIATNHRKQGFLWFKLEKEESLTWFVMNVLEHALTACALYFLKENAIEMTEIRLKDNFILQLAKQQHADQQHLNSKAELLGYDLSLTYICIAGEIRLKEETSLVPKLKRDNPPTSSLQSLNYYIQKEITNAGKLIGRKTMATFDEGEVIVYLETDHHLHTETANQFLDTIERRLNELLTEVELTWGIAAHKNANGGFYESYQEAKTALEIGKQQAGIGERTFFKDTRINRMLMAISGEEAIRKIVKDTIQPLIDYDRKRQTDLIHTFMTYNKYKGNVSQTARALNLHRQSLLYRLRNIESLTQLSLVNSDDIFLLELSIRLWTLRKIE